MFRYKDVEGPCQTLRQLWNGSPHTSKQRKTASMIEEMKFETNARAAIAKSMDRHEIIHMQRKDNYPTPADIYLLGSCESRTVDGPTSEYWGVTQGKQWRVHVTSPEE